MKVKFCGITNLEDAKEAIKQGVDYLGFVIDFPKSPRSISTEEFLDIAGRIKQEHDNSSETVPKIVAVTVNMLEEKLEETLIWPEALMALILILLKL